MNNWRYSGGLDSANPAKRKQGEKITISGVNRIMCTKGGRLGADFTNLWISGRQAKKNKDNNYNNLLINKMGEQQKW